MSFDVVGMFRAEVVVLKIQMQHESRPLNGLQRGWLELMVWQKFLVHKEAKFTSMYKKGKRA